MNIRQQIRFSAIDTKRFFPVSPCPLALAFECGIAQFAVLRRQLELADRSQLRRVNPRKVERETMTSIGD
jgi:hypothetical protein